MNTDISRLSDAFQRLYCDPAVFDSLSTVHPISFERVLPFQPGDSAVVDDLDLLHAEETYMAQKKDSNRLTVVEAYARCNLLSATDANNLKPVIDHYDTDFFDLMGETYANAGMFICALRWYRELVLALGAQTPNARNDIDGAHASVGYCLYSLGLFEEAITWSKACLGQRPFVDAECQALINSNPEIPGSVVRSIERAGTQTRYVISAPRDAYDEKSVARLHAALKASAPSEEIYIQVIKHNSPGPQIQPDGYPFKPEYDGTNLTRHKMNLIFATCFEADALMGKGDLEAAKRLLSDAFLIEPAADILKERLKALTES